MNILDAEEMVEAEQLLLQVQTHHPYTFAPPEPSLIPVLQTFSSSHFLPAARQIHDQTLRIVSSARNIKTAKKQDPNGCIRVFAYSVFALIFPTGSTGNRGERQIVNDSLLETLKCSLYSKDLNFNHIANKHFPVDSLLAKTMMAKFFHSVIERKQFSNGQKIRFIQWTFEKNPILEELFILFYRIILTKLYVQGADDYGCPLNFSEVITNLIQYFDISYRNFGELFLISEENYFLASVHGCLVMGEYDEKGGKIGKQSAKTTDEKGLQESEGSPKEKHETFKKNGVFEKDIKLFNFILESGRESHNANDRDVQMETPHFKDSHEFAFGRKRKDQQQVSRQEQLKKEFQKFFMSSEAESVEEGEIEHAQVCLTVSYLEMAGIPLKKSEQIETRPRHQTEQGELPEIEPSFFKKDTFKQSLIDELEDEISDQPKVNPENHHKNIVMVKDKNIATFSPQITHHLKNQGFGSFANDALFLDQDANPDLFKSSSGENAENMFPNLCQCKCMEHRKKKNHISSKVVDFMYFEAKTHRAPKFIQNLMYSQKISNNTPKLGAFPKQSLNLRQYPSNKQLRKPSFLKFLKKDKQIGERSCSSNSKSKSKSKRSANPVPSLQKQQPIRFNLDKETISKINDKCTAFSTIMTKNQLDVKPKLLSTKSATKRDESTSLTKRTPVKQSVIKNFDSKYFNERPGLGRTWKMDNFQLSPKNMERMKPNPQGVIQTSRNEKVRVYAPVNIIAPTVYFNGVTERDNRVIFTVNDANGRQQNQQLKLSEIHLRAEPSYVPPYERLGNPHQKYI